MVDIRRKWLCPVTCAVVLLGAFMIVPERASAQLATVAPEPYIFVPDGQGAELLLDSQDNLYWLHVISGDVYFRRYNSSHVLEIPDKLLYNNGANENVDAAWDDLGYIHFTWATDYFGAQSVMYAKIDTNGDFLVAPIKLSGNNTARDFSSAIATNSLGQAYVAWDYWWNPSDPIAEDVLYAKIDSDGSIIFTQQYVAPESWDTDFHAKKDIVVDRNDNLHVIFDRCYSSSLNINVYYKKYASDGTTVLVSEKQVVSAAYSTWSSSLEAVLDSQDRIDIAYSYGFGARIEVFYARIDLQGNLEIGPVQLSQADSFHSHQAYLAIDEADNSYVFWRENKDGNAEVYYAVMDENGIVVQSPSRVTYTPEDNGIYYMGAVFNFDNFCIWSYYDANGTYVVIPSGYPITTIVPGLPRYGTSPRFVTGATPFSFIVSDPNGTGIRGTYYQIDSPPWINYTMGGPFVVPGEGPHLILYNSTSLDGMPEPTKQFDIVVDDTPPTSLPMVGIPNHTRGSDIWISSSTSIVVNSVDGGLVPVGVNWTKYRVRNGGSWTPWSDYDTPFTIGPAEGISYVEVYSSDLLWNSEAVLNVTFIVDNTPPTSQLYVGEPNYTAANAWITFSTPITLTAKDGGLIPVGISETFYRTWQSGSWDSWHSFSLPFTLNGEGATYVEYYSVDLLNATEAVNNATFIVDNDPPTTRIQIGQPNYTATDTWIKSSTPISLTAADGGNPPVGLNRTLYRAWAGGWTPWQEYSSPFNLGTEGLNMVEFYSVDLLGNQEIAQVVSLIVDDTPPLTTFVVGYPRYRPSSSSWWNVTSSTPLSLSAQDGGPIQVGVSIMECRIIPSPTWVECSSPFNLSGHGEGPQRIEFRSIDLLGNTEAYNFINLIVDDSPPYSTLLPGLPLYAASDVWVTSNTQFEMLSPDDGSPPVGTNYSLYRVWNGEWSPWLSYSSPFSVGQSEGYTHVEYYAVDLVSNKESLVNETFIVDNTPPITSMQVIGPNYTHVSNIWVNSSTSIKLVATDDGIVPVGVNSTFFRIWAGSWTPWQDYSSPFSLDAEGLNYVEFWSEDLLGNREASHNATVIVDNTPPTTMIEIGDPKYRGSPNAHWNVTSATMFLLHSEDGGPVPCGVMVIELFIDDAHVGDYTTGFTLQGLEDGVHRIDFRAIDNMLNAENRFQEHNLVLVNLDNSPPTTSIHPDRADVDLDDAFVLEADDGQGSGVREILVSVDGGSWETYTGEFSFGEYGHHTVAFRSVDNLGNSELPAELAFEITEPSENLKPLIALIFSIILLVCGLVVSRRRPIRFKTGRSSLKTFLVLSLPFCLAEVMTGVISLITGLLAVPPLLGLGMVLDLGILLAGLILLAVHGRQEVGEGSGREMEEDIEMENPAEEPS
ncbi:MAG: OmpL47-type beta-barrel domain-containing protein [Thermoplasmata archaeon]